MSKPSTPIVLNVSDWDTSSIRYMQPKVNDRGAKSITVISTQSNRALHLATPLMMTWGIADFVDDKGESDGKFSMSLNFPNENYKTDGTDDFLVKLKQFENQILDDAVKYSDAWFGEDLSREVVKHNFFPFLKYSKDKLTKKVDATKPPSIRARVPNYNNKWGIEIYDTQQNRIFPSDNENLTPMDFVPKMSNVACVLQCGGLWFGGKGWGLTWKVNQVVVKPREVVSVYGKCHITLSNHELETMEKTTNYENDSAEEEEETQPKSVEVADSSDEDDDAVEISTPEPVAPAPKKKIVKKAVAQAEPVENEPTPTPKKKVVKKKVVAA
jgi:hypothetical protein